MDPKNNFLNAQPSITTNDDAARAEDLSTTDNELEKGKAVQPKDEDAFVNSVNDAEEIESLDADGE